MRGHDQCSQSEDADRLIPPKGRRRRPPLSCVECRRRKLKCNRVHPCSNCVHLKKGEQCFFTGPQPPKASSESINHKPAPALRQRHPTAPEDTGSEPYHMFVLDAKTGPRYSSFQKEGGECVYPRFDAGIAREDALQTPKSLGSDNMPGIQVSAQHDCIDDRVRNLPDCAFRGINGRTRYFGRSNHSITLSYFQGISSFVGRAHLRVKEADLREFKLHELIPQRCVADQLVQLYLNTFEPTWRTLCIPTFLENYHEFWKDPKATHMDKEFIAQLLGVMAAGISFYGSSLDRCEREDVEKKATRWITEAQAYIACNLASPDLDLRRIQTQCILLIARLSIAGDDDESQEWIASGLLVRSAMSIGLHRDPSRFRKESQRSLQPELRRRLWFTIVELDLMISIHRGFCPSLDLSECDCEPPSAVFNDSERTADLRKGSGSLRGIILPPPLYQTLLNRSLQLRVAITKKVNTLKFDLAYDDVLRLSEEMLHSMQVSSSIFENYLSSNDTSASDSAQVAQHRFAQSLHLFIMRKFLLSLHRPFSSSANQLPKYSYSRKIALEQSLDVLSQRGRSATNEFVYPQITQLANSMFQKEVYHSVVTVCVEISLQAREKTAAASLGGNSPGFLSSMIQSQQKVMLQAVEHTLHDFGQQLGAGGKGCKFYFCIALILGFVKAQLDGKDPLPVVEATSRYTSQICQAVIQGQSYSDVMGLYNHMQPNPEKGGILETHKDVPDEIGDELYMAAQQRQENERRKGGDILRDGSPYPPININVHPSHPTESVTSSGDATGLRAVDPLKIPGFTDVAVKEYSEWLASDVTDNTPKAGFRQACQVTLSDGFELEHTRIKTQNSSSAEGSDPELPEVLWNWVANVKKEMTVIEIV
ncbi:hypothetical protein N7468_001825 [Penicillium chermesinum]|uniref:Zn(2)-C6 fungal-type domain-containing protein n=1 Tax=Penicillium chermesinum TaxID=63820 RepID=A0A9W9PIL4_9EURO|nr:uncharacterized protein N7468_001825 [Penicillium chermesinum]KAJ5246842.1 hypothetical protein N7468_001825 [Penicillium chermesinum]KAJ6145101.1 hypothetical protein N7470_008996 [Penicillium chermesinum]